MIARQALGLLSIVALLVPAACSSKKADEAAASTHAAAAIGPAECAACGMVVREQPSPRAQAVHRDGTRAFLCSVDELRHYQMAPSPHGAVTASWVETVDPALNPAETPVETRPWSDAKAMSYVVGVTRPRVMGPPALAFETRAQAQAFAKKHGPSAVVRTWDQLGAPVQRDGQADRYNTVGH
jgi:nitrous oxide reductase accessory protein NosL